MNADDADRRISHLRYLRLAAVEFALRLFRPRTEMVLTRIPPPYGGGSDLFASAPLREAVLTRFVALHSEGDGGAAFGGAAEEPFAVGWAEDGEVGAAVAVEVAG